MAANINAAPPSAGKPALFGKEDRNTPLDRGLRCFPEHYERNYKGNDLSKIEERNRRGSTVATADAHARVFSSQWTQRHDIENADLPKLTAQSAAKTKSVMNAYRNESIDGLLHDGHHDYTAETSRDAPTGSTSNAGKSATGGSGNSRITAGTLTALEALPVYETDVPVMRYDQLYSLSQGSLLRHATHLHDTLSTVGIDVVLPKCRGVEDLTRWVLATQVHLMLGLYLHPVHDAHMMDHAAGSDHEDDLRSRRDVDEREVLGPAEDGDRDGTTRGYETDRTSEIESSPYVKQTLDMDGNYRLRFGAENTGLFHYDKSYAGPEPPQRAGGGSLSFRPSKRTESRGSNAQAAQAQGQDNSNIMGKRSTLALEVHFRGHPGHVMPRRGSRRISELAAKLMAEEKSNRHMHLQVGSLHKPIDETLDDDHEMKEMALLLRKLGAPNAMIATELRKPTKPFVDEHRRHLEADLRQNENYVVTHGGSSPKTYFQSSTSKLAFTQHGPHASHVKIIRDPNKQYMNDDPRQMQLHGRLIRREDNQRGKAHVDTRAHAFDRYAGNRKSNQNDSFIISGKLAHHVTKKEMQGGDGAAGVTTDTREEHEKKAGRHHFNHSPLNPCRQASSHFTGSGFDRSKDFEDEYRKEYATMMGGRRHVEPFNQDPSRVRTPERRHISPPTQRIGLDFSLPPTVDPGCAI
ncbi:unnamed protein product, partial [Amoebophrya sp. A25]|eukprot:GSA25T00017094001.1